MRSFFQRYKITLLAATLLIATLLGSLLPIVSAEASPSLDYGVVGAKNNIVYTAEELYSLLYSEDTTPEEAAYLNRYSNISFSYSNAVPNDTVSTFYDGTAGTLTVVVRPHTYVANNGETVSWVPSQIHVEGVSYPLTKNGNGYEVILENLFYSEDFDMEVDFSWSVVIPATVADRLKTDPYNAAEENLAILVAYENSAVAFEAALAKHEAYLLAMEAYRAAEKAHNDYQSLKADYDKRKAAHDAYLKAKAAYDIRYNAYMTYCDELKVFEQAVADYRVYDDYVKNTQAKYFAYLEYRSAMEPIEERLAVMEALFAYDSHGWNFYNSLIGGTVSIVLDNQEALITAGGNPQDIHNAGDSTERLIAIMNGYASLRSAKYSSEHKKTAALFAYYQEHYTSLATNFRLLFSSLEALYQNPLVAKAANERGKLERLREFIGQLYVTATCLDDQLTQSNNWGIITDWREDYKEASKIRLPKLVEAAHLVKDKNDASPAGITVPEEKEKVEKVDPVPPPGDPPAYVEDPRADEPDPVPHPGDEPTFVPHPGDEPDFVPHPGDAPAEPQMDPILRTLAEQLRANELIRRTPQGVDHTLFFDRTITFPVSIRNLLTLVFYDMDGVTELDRQILDYGEEIFYHGPSTEREATAEYSYRFNGWYTFDGKEADLTMITSNLSLIASYKVTKQSYAVTWIVDGRTHEVSGHYYGETPVCKNPPKKASDQGYDYVFSGWSPSVETVTGNATYHGTFEAVPRTYTVTWELGETVISESYEYGSFPQFAGNTDKAPDNYTYTFLGWREKTGGSALSSVRGDVTYVAEYSRQPLAVDPQGGVCDVTYTDGAMTIRLTDMGRVGISAALTLAKETQRTLTLVFGDTAVTLTTEAVNTLLSQHVSGVSMVLSAEQSGVRTDVRFHNRAWHTLNVTVPMTVSIGFVPKTGMLASCYLLDENGEWIEQEISRTGGKAVFSTERFTSVLFREEYFLRVESAPNCDLFSIPSRVVAGDTVDLEKATCFYGYEIVGVTVTLADGTLLATDNGAFVMPASAVSVRIATERIVYHVEFIVNGNVISSYDRFLGELIEFPENPTLPAEGDWIYTFVGWSSNLKAAYGDNRSLVYEAKFTRSNPVENDVHSTRNNNMLLTVYLPILGGALLLFVVSFILIRRFRRQIAAFFRGVGRGVKHLFSFISRTVGDEMKIEQEKQRRLRKKKDADNKKK